MMTKNNITFKSATNCPWNGFQQVKLPWIESYLNVMPEDFVYQYNTTDETFEDFSFGNCITKSAVTEDLMLKELSLI